MPRDFRRDIDHYLSNSISMNMYKFKWMQPAPSIPVSLLLHFMPNFLKMISKRLSKFSQPILQLLFRKKAEEAFAALPERLRITPVVVIARVINLLFLWNFSSGTCIP